MDKTDDSNFLTQGPMDKVILEGNDSESSLPKHKCFKCCRKHDGKYLADLDGCFGCVINFHRMSDCPMLF